MPPTPGQPLQPTDSDALAAILRDDARFEPLRHACARWSSRGHLVADTYGPPLRWFADLPTPVLLKINRDELRSLVPGEAEPGPTLAALAARSPASRWIVSDGPHAVWFDSAGQPPAFLVPPTVREASPTGSGDVLLAAVLHGLFVRHLPLPAAVAFALPFAAANAAHPGIAEFPPLPGENAASFSK